MKFCRDCKHFEPGFAFSGLGFVYASEGICRGMPSNGQFDLVTGTPISYHRIARAFRDRQEDCGTDGKWFEPANLDGRLAILNGEAK